MEKESKLLAMCSWCKSLRISKDSKTWLKQENDPELYKTMIETYGEGNITHSICESCTE